MSDLRDQFSNSVRVRLNEIREQQRGLHLEEIDLMVAELRRIDPIQHGNAIAVITAMRQQIAAADLHDPKVRSQLIAMAMAARSPVVGDAQSKSGDN